MICKDKALVKLFIYIFLCFFSFSCSFSINRGSVSFNLPNINRTFSEVGQDIFFTVTLEDEGGYEVFRKDYPATSEVKIPSLMEGKYIAKINCETEKYILTGSNSVFVLAGKQNTVYIELEKKEKETPVPVPSNNVRLTVNLDSFPSDDGILRCSYVLNDGHIGNTVKSIEVKEKSFVIPDFLEKGKVYSITVESSTRGIYRQTVNYTALGNEKEFVSINDMEIYNLYVSDSGKTIADGGDGSKTNPLKSIDEAVTKSPRTIFTINVQGNVSCNLSLANTYKIKIVGMGKDAVLNGNKTESVLRISGGGVITLKNLTVTNGFPSNGMGGGAFIGLLGTLKLEENVIFDANSAGQRGSDVYLEGGTSKLYLSCNVKFNKRDIFMDSKNGISKIYINDNFTTDLTNGKIRLGMNPYTETVKILYSTTNSDLSSLVNNFEMREQGVTINSLGEAIKL